MLFINLLLFRDSDNFGVVVHIVGRRNYKEVEQDIAKRSGA